MPLESEMRQVLLSMQLLGSGRTQNFNAQPGRSENPDPRPSGEPNPIADEWAAQWDRDPSERTLAAATAALRAWKVRDVPAVTDGTSEDDWILEKEGFAAEQVARYFNTTASRVRRLRLKHDRSAEYGVETQALLPSASKETRVALLSERGLSSRQVADQVGLHKTQVLRILARLRNAA